jgi:hypothetical protein
MKESPLQKVRRRHAELLELRAPGPVAPGLDVAIHHIDAFLRRTDLTPRIKEKARVARSSLRGILKLL